MVREVYDDGEGEGDTDTETILSEIVVAHNLASPSPHPYRRSPVSSSPIARSLRNRPGRAESGKRDRRTRQQRSSGRQRPPKKRRSNKNYEVWACPFATAEPQAHQRCWVIDPQKWSDLVRHMTNRHAIEAHRLCPNCYKRFKSHEIRAKHSRNCRLNVPRNSKLVDRDEMRAIMYDAELSEEENWFALWKRLFPDLVAPNSPYKDGTRNFDMKRSLEVALPGHIRDCFGFVPSGDQVSQFSDMVLAAMPQGRFGTIDDANPMTTDISSGRDHPTHAYEQHAPMEAPGNLVSSPVVDPQLSNEIMPWQNAHGNEPMSLGQSYSGLLGEADPSVAPFSQHAGQLETVNYFELQHEPHFANAFYANNLSNNE